ncbi:MAG: glycosyltransferase family 9 protein [Deltaproteobacteria bacterium]|nr:glycosyltransferase family 9 protein [Deltaproteobacteria bacterium]
MRLPGEKILVVKYSSLGDIINAMPAVRLLKEAGGMDVYWLVKEELAEVLDCVDFLDGAILLSKGLGGIRAASRAAKSIDLTSTVDLMGIFKSGVITYLSGTSNRISFPHTREFSSIFYNRTMGLDRSTGIHAVRENVSVVEGILGKKFSDEELDYGIVQDGPSILKAKELLKSSQKGPLVVINPMTRWPSKVYPKDKFSHLVRGLTAEGIAVAFVGVGKDKAYIDSIIEGSGSSALNLAGKSDLKTLISIIKMATMVVSCDSGPMHIASAVDTPVLAIFGPTDPSYTGPFRSNSRVISTMESCSPCRKRSCSDRFCMDNIDPESVYGIAMEMIEEYTK